MNTSDVTRHEVIAKCMNAVSSYERLSLFSYLLKKKDILKLIFIITRKFYNTNPISSELLYALYSYKVEKNMTSGYKNKNSPQLTHFYQTAFIFGLISTILYFNIINASK